MVEAPAVAEGVEDGGGAGAPELVFGFGEGFGSGGDGLLEGGVAVIDFDGEEAGAHLAFGEGLGVHLGGFAGDVDEGFAEVHFSVVEAGLGGAELVDDFCSEGFFVEGHGGEAIGDGEGDAE